MDKKILYILCGLSLAMAVYFLKQESGLHGIGEDTDEDLLDEKELKAGIKVEMEHTDNESLARRIAIDHLTEDPKYYTHLLEMERKYKHKK